MTRHIRSIYRFTTSTKENKVKPTEHTAKPAVTPKTGRFATLRALLHAQGSGAPARGPIIAPLIVLCVLLALSAAVAQAEPPKLISYGQFSAQEAHADGVAVEGSGDLFVSGLLGEGFAPSTVVKLDPSGKLLSPPSPFGSAHYSGVAVNPTNGDVYVLGQEGIFAACGEDLRLRPQHGRVAGRRLKCRRHAISAASSQTYRLQPTRPATCTCRWCRKTRCSSTATSGTRYR